MAGDSETDHLSQRVPAGPVQVPSGLSLAGHGHCDHQTLLACVGTDA